MMQGKYKMQDIILMTDYTMITSKIVDDVIIVYVYANEFSDRKRWILNEEFTMSRREFSDISNRMSFLLAGYIRKMCTMKAIYGRLHQKVDIRVT